MQKKPSHGHPSARSVAAKLLEAVLANGKTLDAAISAMPLHGSEADMKFTRLLVLTVMRHLGQIDAVIAACMDKPLPAKRRNITNALRLGMAQLLLLDTPSHAAVNETVALVKHGKDAGLAGLVNAVLQKVAREKPLLPDALCNLPAEVAARWTEYYGAKAVRAIAEVAAMRPPLDMHHRLSDDWKIESAIENAVRLDSHITRLPADHAAVETLPGFAEGAFFIQDIAASYPVRLLGNVRDHQVLDVCAAPGGKTMQLLARGAFVTALDSSGPRLRRLKQNLTRMQVAANVVTADVLAWQPSRAYDAVLLDAPCSATGTWRRHPEVVRLASEASITELASLQRAMLTRAWGWVKPGGKLLYCVCSLERVEGEDQAAWFLAAHPDAQVHVTAEPHEIPAICLTEEGYLRTRPDMLRELGGMDGFFGACFVKAPV